MYWFYSTYVPLALLPITLLLLYLGLRGIVSRRPFLFPARWLWASILLAGSPVFLRLLISLNSATDTSVAQLKILVASVFVAVLLIYVSLTVRGFLALGVTDAAFREALVATLEKLDLPGEESLSKIRLTSIGIDLKVTVDAWVGAAQIRATQNHSYPLLAEICQQMNHYFRTSNVRTNLKTCIILGLLGGCLAATTVSFATKLL